MILKSIIIYHHRNNVRTYRYVCMYTCKKADDAKLTKTDDNDAMHASIRHAPVRF